MQRRSSTLAKHLFIGLCAAIALLPVLLIVSTAFKSQDDVLTDPFGLFTSFTGENFARVWDQGGFGGLLWNSVLISVPCTLLTVVLSTLGGYAVGRLKFRGNKIALYLILVALLVPFFAIMVPLYFQLRQYGLLNSLLGVILVLTTLNLPLGIFLMQSFFKELPSAIEQAARIDGCTEWQVFRHVMMPLVGPAAAALSVITFLHSWNNLIVPLLYLPGADSRPLVSGLYLLISGQGSDIAGLAAGSMIMLLPILLLFVVAQRQLVRGLTLSAVKG